MKIFERRQAETSFCHVPVTYFLIGMQGTFTQRVCYSQKDPLNLLTKHSHFIFHFGRVSFLKGVLIFIVIEAGAAVQWLHSCPWIYWFQFESGCL